MDAADPNPAADRWLAVGQSSDADARLAGKAAAAEALAGADPSSTYWRWPDR